MFVKPLHEVLGLRPQFPKYLLFGVSAVGKLKWNMHACLWTHRHIYVHAQIPHLSIYGYNVLQKK